MVSAPYPSSQVHGWTVPQFRRFGHKYGPNCIFSIAHAQNGHISTSCQKSDVTVVFPNPDFLPHAEIFGDTCTFKADIAFFIFALIFRTSGPNMAIFRGKIGEGVGRYWPPTNSFLLLGVYTSVSNLVKIDKEMRPWEGWHTDRHTHTHRQTQTDFIICPIAICYSYGTVCHCCISCPVIHTRLKTLTFGCYFSNYFDMLKKWTSFPTCYWLQLLITDKFYK